jgi:hypothetical protein
MGFTVFWLQTIAGGKRPAPNITQLEQESTSIHSPRMYKAEAADDQMIIGGDETSVR